MNIVIEKIEFEQIEVGLEGQTLNGACYVHFNCWNNGIQMSGKAKVDNEDYRNALNNLREHIKMAVSEIIK